MATVFGNFRVEVSRARGWKCERCWKITPEVGLSEEDPTLCMRCCNAVTGEEAQVFEWAAARFDHFYSDMRAKGLTQEEALAEAAGLNNLGQRNDGNRA
jgi:hypothetical protein